MAFNESGIAPESPLSLKDAKESGEWEQWEKAIMMELDQLQMMGTWELVDLPEGGQAIGVTMSCILSNPKIRQTQSLSC